MASNADTGILVDSQVGVHKIHYKRVDKYRSCFIRIGSALSSQGIDSGPAGLFRIDPIDEYAGFSDLAFDRSIITVISQHNLVFACSEGFNRSYWETADSGSSDHRFKSVCMDLNFSCNRLAYSDNVKMTTANISGETGA